MAEPNRRSTHDYPTLGEFRRVGPTSSPALNKWKAVLADGTGIVVADHQGAPCLRGIAKAQAIVQSRWYLEPRALQLLRPVVKFRGAWRLSTMDFGGEAEQRGCEFLLCFEFHVDRGELPYASPYAAIGFQLPAQTGPDPVFVLTVKILTGVPA